MRFPITSLFIVIVCVKRSELVPQSTTETSGDSTFNDTIRQKASKLDLNVVSVEDVTVMDVSKRELETLEILENSNFDSLQYLDASHNKLTKISANLFAHTPKIVQIDFSYNKISVIEEIAFESLTELEVLDLSHNRIAYFSNSHFENKAKLKRIDLRGNQITAIFICNSETRLPHCASLYLPWDATASLNIASDCVNRIFINGADLIYMSKPNTDDGLTCQINEGRPLNNVLEVLQFLNPKVQKISMSGHYIGKLNCSTFARFTKLEHLHLATTGLQDFDCNPFEELKKLRVLDISQNNFTTLNVPLLGETLRNLRTLATTNNKFIKNAADDIRQLGALRPSIISLKLSGTPIGKLNGDTFSGFEKLASLELEGTGLTDFDSNPFKRLKLLKVLNLNNNKLVRPNFGAEMPELIELSLNNNNLIALDDITRSNYKSLRSIHVVNSSIPCEYLKKWRSQWQDEFKLRDSCVSRMFKNSIRDMRILDVTHQGIDALYPEDLNFNSLEIFNVSHNEIKIIENDLFKNTPKLVEIDFAHCLIRQIGYGVFEHLTELKVLDVSHNRIEYFSYFQLENQAKLKRIDLRGNQITIFSCDSAGRLPHCASLYFPWDAVTILHMDTSCINRTQLIIDGTDLIYMPKPNTDDGLPCPINEGRPPNNVLEALEFVNPSIEEISMSGLYIGKLNCSTFARFTKLEHFYLATTGLQDFDCNPFKELKKLRLLDISQNNFTTLNVPLLGETLRNLEIFTATNNKFIKNAADDIRQLGALRPPITALDLSGTPIGKLNGDTFLGFEKLEFLTLPDTNLTDFDNNPFERLKSLVELDLSNNNLVQPNFDGTMPRLYSLLMVNNSLTALNGISRANYNYLMELNVLGNPISCDYLKEFRSKWIGDFHLRSSCELEEVPPMIIVTENFHLEVHNINFV